MRQIVPELIAITRTAWSEEVDPALVKGARLWETLSLVRLSVLVVLAIVLFLGLTRPAVKVDAYIQALLFENLSVMLALIGIFYIPLCNICGFVMTYSRKKIIAKVEIALVDFNVYSTVDIRLRKL